MNLKRYIKIFAMVILACLIVSCADSEDPIRTETKGWSAQRMYDTASAARLDKSYTRAINLYKVLEATYPYGIYAQQGLIDLAYVYYQNDQPELAIPTIDQFIRTYPSNTNMDYALYLKGYIYYKNDNGLLSRFTKQDLSERDPKNLQEAYKAFAELVNKYPNSRFAPDAKDKANRLVNAMSRGEIYKASYYMQIKAYLAAISRAQNVITNYSHTQYVEDALAIQVVAYDKLNEPQLSKQIQQVLAINFPQSQYLINPWTYQGMAWYAIWQ